MMYICSQSINLVKYHLKNKGVQYEYCITEDPQVVIEKLHQGNPIKKPCVVIDYRGKKKLDITHKNKFNVIYLISSSKWINRNLIKREWVELLNVDSSMYLNSFSKYKQLFYPDAADYFIDKFQDNPYQFNVELMKCIIKVSIDKKLITLDYLEKQYEFLGAPTLLNSVGLLGTSQMLELLKSITNNELWIFFIDRGSRYSILEEYLVKRIDSTTQLQGLMYLKQAIYNNTMSVENSCYLYCLWLYKEESINTLIKWLNL